TEHALRNFQRDYGLVVDGICGAATLRALRQLSPKVRGGRPVFLREQERVRRAGPLLRGKRIVIDPGHGGADQGVTVGQVPEAGRARFANETGADLFLSLHNDANSSPNAQGVACFHYGTGNGTTSTVGEALAGFILRELAARTGMVDCRAHPKTWDSLRMTRC